MRSDERSKFGGLDEIIKTIVFSLKPALTSLTTSALVSGPSFCFVCALTPMAQPINKQKTIRVVGKKDLIAHPLALLRIRHVVFCTWLPARQSVAFSDRFNVVARLSIRRDVATILEHRAFASIITRQHQIDFSAEHVHQLAHVLRPAPDVFSRIKRLSDTQPPSCSRH